MTQAEKTEAVIRHAESIGRGRARYRVEDLESHARDLALRLDAVLVELDERGWPDYLIETRANIRAIIEAE